MPRRRKSRPDTPSGAQLRQLEDDLRWRWRERQARRYTTSGYGDAGDDGDGERRGPVRPAGDRDRGAS